MPNYLEFNLIYIFSASPWILYLILHLPNNIKMKFNAEVTFDYKMYIKVTMYELHLYVF